MFGGIMQHATAVTTHATATTEEAPNAETSGAGFPWHELERVTERISVCLFSDDQLFRAGCEHLLSAADRFDLRLSAGLLTRERALGFLTTFTPDVLIVGVADLDGATLEFLAEAHAAHPDGGLILVYGRAEGRVVSELRGISSSLRKGFACVGRDSIASAQHLTQLIEAVADGRILLDQKVMARLFESHGERNAISERLSRRESEVLDLMARGLTNPGIAEELCLERKTVERHINSIYTKLGDQAGEGHPRVNTVLAYLRAAGRLDSAA